MQTRIALSNKKAEAISYLCCAGFLLFIIIKTAPPQSVLIFLFLLLFVFLHLTVKSFRTPSIFFDKKNLYLRTIKEQQIIPLKNVVSLNDTGRRINYFPVYHLIYHDITGYQHTVTFMAAGRRLSVFQKQLKKEKYH